MLFIFILFVTHIIFYIVLFKLFPVINIKYIGFSLFVMFITVSIAYYPDVSINAALKGFNLWKRAVMPSLFPFFVCTYMIIHLNIAYYIGKICEPIMRPIFNVPGTGAVAFVVGIISGYPVGAKTAGDLYENGLCSKTEAERLLSFCNNSGPLFILGTVACVLLDYPEIGIVLYTSHVISSVITGIIFRFYKYRDKKTNMLLHKKNSSNINITKVFSDAIIHATNLIIKIAGFIIFFSVLIGILKRNNIIMFIRETITFFIPINPYIINSIIYGFLEIANGVNNLSLGNIPLNQKFIISSLIIGWAGLSVHCQVAGFLLKYNLNLKPYILGKTVQSFISAIITTLLLRVFIVKTVTVFNSLYTINQTIDKYPKILDFILIFIILITLICLKYNKKYTIINRFRNFHK